MFWLWTLTSLLFVVVSNLSHVPHLNTPHQIVWMYGFEKELGIWFLIVLPINGYQWCKNWLRLCLHVWICNEFVKIWKTHHDTKHLISFTIIDFVKLNVKWSMFEFVHVKSELNNKFHAKVNSRDKSSKF